MNLKDFLADPGNLLHGLNLEKGDLAFLALGPERLRSMAFLDDRFLGPEEKRFALSLAHTYQGLADQGLSLRGPNFIFHHAFCCSTLLARCLDLPGKNLSLKEPHILLDLSRYQRALDHGKLNFPNWSPLVDLVLALLARPLAPNETVLVKPSNAANNLVPSIAKSARNAKTLLLYSSLERFLVTVAGGGAKREQVVDSLLAVFLQDHQQNLPVRLSGIPLLPPLCRAALMWGLQMKDFQTWMAGAPEGRVASLDCEIFLDNPETTLEHLASFFGLELGPEAIDGIIGGEAFSRHSKDQGQAYSTSLWQARREEILKTSGGAVENAIAWAKEAGFPEKQTLLNPLLD